MIRARYRGKYEEQYAEVERDGKKVRELVSRAPVEFVEGAPARNLDEDEWQAMDAETRDRVRKSGLYDVKTDAQMAGKES